jgi:alpha-1,3-rhamnosyl/mannosyltransferase
MRVVINAIPTTGPKTGIGHYVAELLRCLPAQAGNDEIHGYTGGWVGRLRRMGRSLKPVLEPRATVMEATASKKRNWKAWLLSQMRLCGEVLTGLHFRGRCRTDGYDVYHEPNFIPIPCDRPTVATLHDLSVLLHPEWHPADRVAHFERRFHQGLARCTHFLAISEFARQEIIDTLHLRPEQVTRTYMGVRPGLGALPPTQVRASLQRLGLPPRYFLYLGTMEPRKNVLTLLRAYCALPEQVREAYPLVLVGGWGWNAGNVAAYLHDEARHRGVRHLGYLPEKELPVLYNGARALVFPSFYEGFGLPPIEMMACGGAVLASTAGALVETVGKHAYFVEPLDVDGWREALARVATDDDWWNSLRRGVVEHARPFTWEQCAADTLRVYRRVCGRGETSDIAPLCKAG